MQLKRMKDLPRNTYSKYRERQLAGSMSEYYDDDGYLLYDEDEVETYKPKKRGRPTKKQTQILKFAETEDVLINIGKKLERLEEQDVDYAKNPKWLKLKKQQDLYYLQLAKEKLEQHKNEYQIRHTDYDKKQILFYKNYIEQNKNKKEN